MKQIKKYVLLIIFLFSSFYFTNQEILTMRDKDEIMKQIDKNSEKYTIASIDAIVSEKTIVPGVKGQMVDREKSYNKMKQYGNYNETLTVMKEVEPNISIDSYYDKYIEKGNNQKRRIALVFPITDEEMMKKILMILKREKIRGTFFIDGNQIDDLVLFIKKYTNHEYELLSFEGEYNPYYIKTAETYLENITKKETKYCYTEEDNKKLLNICGKNKHHTIQPKLVLSKDLTYQVKNQLENGLILSIHLNDNHLDELSIMINYIKTKGYQFETLDELLKE
ncbi:MAG: hypothetical protein IKF71_00845 [Bacilli bacterium]|nr:hypothetical protein [Bacilli bacterium]